jgi:hypothetical protein
MHMRPTLKIVLLAMALCLPGIILFSGCNAQPSDAATEKKASSQEPAVVSADNTKVYKDLKDAMGDKEVKSVAIVRIDDMIKKDPNRERQVNQEILKELTKIGDLKVVEGDQKEIDRFFSEKGIEPSRGLSTDSSINLAVFLNVDAIIYGTIESDDIDVNLKVYSAVDGGVIFSQTLSKMILPLSKKSNKFEIPKELLESIPGNGGETASKETSTK